VRQVVIENPVLNSPYSEPKRHFKFDEEGITNEIVEERRISAYFVPVAKPRKRGKQMVFDTEWTEERLEENRFINRVRERVALWRQGGYQGITNTTRRLLEYWQREERDPAQRLFFCQIEALETLIYVTEVARKYGDAWIENTLREANEGANPGLYRIALKMATGSGKTVVMAMVIAWHVLNKLADSQNALFTDTFLVVTPGITIRDRLRVLLPKDPSGDYYRKMDLVPPEELDRLNQANILITNFHAFLLRERGDASKTTKDILREGEEKSPFTESPDQMVRRALREFGNKRNIVVINDEAHHCYRRKPDGESVKLTGDERLEAKKRDEEARVWISGLEAIKQKIGIRVIYDLSATPFFLRGSGYAEGTLFPWVVSDFSLIDAIESGIVKVPRVPVADDSMTGDQPTYRDLWLRIRDHLPKKGRGTEAVVGEPQLPAELQGALHSLYGNYEQYYRQWEQNHDAQANSQPPPVFIVVCNNTNVSKMVYDYIAGWDKPLPDDSTVPVPGHLSILSNIEDGRWLPRPNTILIDSEQLESGEAMSAAFKKIAAREIEEFKADYRIRYQGRAPDAITDEELLREVMNTIGKPGRLGEQVKCVVSVSMLTEGWDANTVTHVLGVRAFGTQLLCEQVVGRGLRRRSYAADDDGMLAAEYAEVYGVPFSFIPSSGATAEIKPGPIPTRVRALEERIACEITFPRLMGYRYDVPTRRLEAEFTEDSRLVLSTEIVPTRTENAPIVGESSIHTLDDLKKKRLQEVAFLLAKFTLEKYFRTDGKTKPEEETEHRFDNQVQAWLFPQVLAICKRWLSECVVYKDNCFPQMLLLIELAHQASDRVYRSIVKAAEGEKPLKPILYPYDQVGSTRHVDFDTTRPTYRTREDKCHVSHVVADTGSWEQKLAQSLEEMDEVICYVKNENLGFKIPYSFNGEQANYVPDFVVKLDDGRGPDDPLNLIIEVTGERKKDKEAKVATARLLWVPAVNNHGEFGRWAFLEITDPWDTKNTIRKAIKLPAVAAEGS
jgi:type III restriction enzyme